MYMLIHVQNTQHRPFTLLILFFLLDKFFLKVYAIGPLDLSLRLLLLCVDGLQHERQNKQYVYVRFVHNSFSFVQLKLLREAFLMFKALATEISFALIFAYLLLIVSTFSLMRTHKQC